MTVLIPVNYWGGWTCTALWLFNRVWLLDDETGHASSGMFWIKSVYFPWPIEHFKISPRVDTRYFYMCWHEPDGVHWQDPLLLVRTPVLDRGSNGQPSWQDW